MPLPLTAFLFSNPLPMLFKSHTEAIEIGPRDGVTSNENGLPRFSNFFRFKTELYICMISEL